MLEDYVDRFKASVALLVVAGVIFLAGAGTGAVLLSRKSELSCPGGGDGSSELQKALDSVLVQFENWKQSPDKGWRRAIKVRAARRDVYRVEEHGSTSYIVLRGTSSKTENDESKWLLIQSWCRADDFYEDMPKVSRAEAGAPSGS